MQAAGRVIRTQQDEGVVHLIDDRFGRPQVRRLLRVVGLVWQFWWLNAGRSGCVGLGGWL